MILRPTDIEDREVGRRRLIHSAIEPLPGQAVAAPCPHRDPLGQHIRRRGDRDNSDIGISLPRRVDDGSRHIDHDNTAGADIIIDGAAQAIKMAVSLPMQREFAAHGLEYVPSFANFILVKVGDLVRVRMHGDMPVIKGVWRQGRRVS